MTKFSRSGSLTGCPQPVLEAFVWIINCGIPMVCTMALLWHSSYSVVCRLEKVNFPSTTSTLPVTVGLILFWFDKNLILSLPEFVVVASTYTEFCVEALSEQ